MRVTKLMGMAVVMVALAATINALAYTTATVSNPFSITVQSTKDATLALEPVVGADAGSGVAINGNGYLQLNVTDQPQPNSVYEYGDVFTITNKRPTTQTLVSAAWYDQANSVVSALPTGLRIKLCDKDDSTKCLGTDTFTVAGMGTKTFTLSIEVDPTYGGTLGAPVNRTLRIIGTN